MAMNEPGEPRHGTGPEHDDAILPCGRDLAALWDLAALSDQADRNRGAPVASETGPHPTGCPHCAAALQDFARLRGAVLHGAQEAGTDWEADAARLTASIMDVVRLELRPGRTLPLGGLDEDAWIYEAVAARTFRSAAELVPGVRSGSCRISPAGSRHPGDRTPADVRIEVTVGMTRDIQLAADRIRGHIAEAAQETLGMRIASIDVAVIDLHHEPTGEDPQ